MTKLLAYHGKPAIKAKYISRMKGHIAADELIHRETEGKTNYGGFKGCAVTCTFNEYSHALAPDEIGYPVELSQLHDEIFEGLIAPYDQAFALEFLEAAKPGADLSLVWSRFAIWMLADPTHGTRRLCEERGKAATERVVALFRERVEGCEPKAASWEAAREDAREAARYAIGGDAKALVPITAAAFAAVAAAWVVKEDYAGEAAEAAALALAEAALNDGGGYAPYKVMSTMLISLIRSAPVVKAI